MKNVKTILGLFPLLLIVLLVSCEGSTEREWRVENSSYTTIRVGASLRYNSDTVYQEVATGETKILTITTEDEGDSEPEEAYNVFSDIIVVNANNELLTKINMLDNDSWDIYIEHTKHKPDHFQQTYTLIVVDSLFN